MRLVLLVVLAAWLLSLARTLLNLWLLPRLRPRLPRRLPRVSVIVPARDEEREIGRAVSGLLAQTWPDLEIIVVNDRSVDRTGEILEGLRRAHPARLTVVTGEEPPDGWLGKPWALHQGALRATGELLLFVDADVMYSPDAVTAAVAELEESGAPMLSLLPHIEMHGFWEHVIMPQLAFVAFASLPLWLANRTRTPLLGVGGGPGNLVRRADYEACGGHAALRDAVIDDVGLARLFRRHGRPTRVARAEQMISVRMYRGGGEAVAGFTKNTFAVFDRNYPVAAAVLVLGIVFHGLPYVLALLGNPLAIAIVLVISLTRGILFGAVGYRMDNALLGHPLMMAAWLWILVRSVWITGVRRRLVWRGRTYDAGRTRFGA